MFVVAWSLLSSITEYARKRRLRTAIEEFYSGPNAKHKMILCRAVAHRLTRVQAAGFSSWGEETANGSLSRVASLPVLPQDEDGTVLYRNENSEVAVIPDEVLPSSDWRLLSSSFSPSSFSIFFIAAHSQAPVSKSEEDALPEAVCLSSLCERIGWSRSRPSEALYACDMDTFTEVVYAWTTGSLRSSIRSRLPVTKMRTVWLSPSTVGSFPSSSSTSSSLSTSSAVSLIPPTKPRPLLEQLFLGDLFAGKLRERFRSEVALHTSNLYGTLPRRSLGRSQASPRQSRSSLRYRACSPLAIDLPRLAHPHHSHFVNHIRTNGKAEGSGTERGSGSGIGNGIGNGTGRTLEFESESARSKEPENGTVNGGIPKCIDEDQLSPPHRGSPVLSSPDRTPTVSPSITISEFGEDHSLAEARIDGLSSDPLRSSFDSPDPDETPRVNGAVDKYNEKYPEQMLESLRSGRRQKSLRRQETAPQRQLCTGESTQSARSHSSRRPPVSPMIAALRRKASVGEQPIVIDPQLQKLTTIELLQRRRHSHMMSPFESVLLQDDGHRRRSLSPMALQDSLHGRFGSGDLFRGTLFGESFRKQASTPTRRMHSSAREKAQKPPPKPPSILVYTAGNPVLFDRIRQNVVSVVPPDVYTVFHISPDAIRRSHWVDPSSACLLIASTHELDDRAWAQLQEYFNKSGKMIFICQNSLLTSLSSCDSIKKQASLLRVAFGEKHGSMTKDLEAFLKKTLKTLAKSGEVNEKYVSKDLVGGIKYSVVMTKKTDAPLLLYMESGGSHTASAVFSDATSEQLLSQGSTIVKDALARVGVEVETQKQAPSLSIGYFIGDELEINGMKSIRYGEEIGSCPHLFLRKESLVKEHPLPSPRNDLLPVQVVSKYSDVPFFDSRKFFQTLKTLTLGRAVLFVPVVTTTMDVSKSLSDALPGSDGLVVIARQQVKGQGRGGNEFLSPIGVAMFTFNCILPSSAALAKNPSFLQHVVSLAVVLAVDQLSGQEDFPLRIKWPNDFYYNRSHKVGGLLVTARTRDDCIEFTIGVGINVSNSRPTICLNDMLPDNHPNDFCVEEVIAMSLNKFEQLLNLYENKGQGKFLEEYYKHWLHSREEVSLGDEHERVIIRGLDQNGFLEVRSRKHAHKLYSVADDGNTFDMMKGLIRMKIK